MDNHERGIVLEWSVVDDDLLYEVYVTERGAVFDTVYVLPALRA
jgi:hypothetical protein